MKDVETADRSHEEVERLIHKIQDNDLNAFGELYELYSNKIYKRCCFVLKDNMLAEDAVHDVFIKMLGKINDLQEARTFEAWFNRLVYNHCIDILRKQNKADLEDWKEEDDPTENLAIVIENLAANEELTAKLRTQLDALNELDRTILSLFYWEGYSVKEIAEMLKITESAVKMRMKRTRDNMKDNFGNDYDVYKNLVILLILQLI